MTKEYYDMYVKENWFICLASEDPETIKNFTKICKIENQDVTFQIESLCNSNDLDELCIEIWNNQKYGSPESLSLQMYFFATEYDFRDCNEICLCNAWTNE